MSGPRITSGTGSKQDYRTPPEFMLAVKKRFGEITFDLAAHAGNTQHAKYFAPAKFVETLELGDLTTAEIMAFGTSLEKRGVSVADSAAFVQRVLEDNMQARAGKPREIEYTVKNSDPNAHGFDAFSQDWALLSSGLLWLNCEFDDVTRWAKKCGEEASNGASILLLTPASVGANWARDLVLPKADVDILSGRLCFDGKNVFPKDCMLSWFRSKYLPGGVANAPWTRIKRPRTLSTWGWREDKIYNSWSLQT